MEKKKIANVKKVTYGNETFLAIPASKIVELENVFNALDAKLNTAKGCCDWCCDWCSVSINIE